MDEFPCGDKRSDKITSCSGIYNTNGDYILASDMTERFVGYYWKDSAHHRCDEAKCPIYKDPIYDRVADRLEGK